MSETFSGQVDVTRTIEGGVAIGTLGPSTVIRLDGDTGDISAGAAGRDGGLILRNGQGFETVRADGEHANLRMGGRGADGDILLFAGDGNLDNDATATIHLDAQAGDIVLRNADCAEEFEVATPGQEIEPGSVVVLDDEGRLRLCEEAYDQRVAGVVSGAGANRPAIELDRQDGRDGRLPVGLVGKLYCKVDAGRGAIRVGDPLTTSATPGHAMKATDPLRGFGAVVGKALRALPEGRGLIPILIAMR